MTEELKPCPFCGGEAEIESIDREIPFYFVVHCGKNDCDIKPSTNYYSHLEESIAAWNTRHGENKK